MTYSQSSSGDHLMWTGHELVDVGVAALTVHAKKRRPEDVNTADLESFVNYCERAYFTLAMPGYLSVLFTSNFLNPSLDDAAKRERVRDILTSYKKTPPQDSPPCTYCGRPSITTGYRDLVPMLSGRGVVNFFPGGGRGLDICGMCLLCIQALSLGAPMVSGRSLIVSTRDHDFLIRFTAKWQAEMRARIQLAEASGKKPDTISYPRTRVVETLIALEQDRDMDNVLDITAYLLSNSGQGPSFQVYHLPASAIRFIILARQELYREAWMRVINESWELSRNGTEVGSKEYRRNFLMEDLFRLPEYASVFLNRYLLKRNIRKVKGAAGQLTWKDRSGISWPLTDLFLKEVLGMKKERIQAIKELAEMLADYIGRNEISKTFMKFYMASKFIDLRRTLLKISLDSVKHDGEPIKLDKFLAVFEEGEEIPRVDWRMARDVMLIRMIEVLHDKYKFFTKAEDEISLDELEEPDEEKEEEA
ncbi:MAG: type I-B CRISPR-associated protein Cas8b1/Cst1 [Bacteroidota bacterium]